MAKNKIRDWSATADANTDIGGIGIQGSDTASNIGPAFRQIMKQVADVNLGNESLDSTFTISSSADSTKTLRFTLVEVPTSTERVLSVEGLRRNGAPIETVYPTAGTFTHTFADATRWFEVEGVGGGAAGQTVRGSADSAAGAGGTSGIYGKSAIITRGSLTTADIVVGAGGTAYEPPSTDAEDGGNSSFSVTGTTITFHGGVTHTDMLLTSATVSMEAPMEQTTADTDLVYAGLERGGYGFTGINGAVSGAGASTPYGRGGIGKRRGTSGGTAGGNGIGSGSGGSGGVIRNLGTSDAQIGGPGASGCIIVREW